MEGSLVHEYFIYMIEAWIKWLTICRCYFQVHFFEWKLVHFHTNFTEVHFKVPVDNKSALVQEMAWYQTGDKTLSEPVIAQFTDA